MYRTTEPTIVGAEPPFAPAGPVAELMSGLPELVERTSVLIQGAAAQLGLDAESAALAGRTATLNSGDSTIAMLPIERADDGTLALVISVQTRLPVKVGGGPGDAVAVLQHAPGALHAFSASIGATPDGCWVLHRSVRVAADDAQALASHLLQTLQLADFVLASAPQDGH
jgi:hypothetical protein